MGDNAGTWAVYVQDPEQGEEFPAEALILANADQIRHALTGSGLTVESRAAGDAGMTYVNVPIGDGRDLVFRRHAEPRNLSALYPLWVGMSGCPGCGHMVRQHNAAGACDDCECQAPTATPAGLDNARDADNYRYLLSIIRDTMTNPDLWDGEDSESYIMGRYIKWLAAGGPTDEDGYPEIRDSYPKSAPTAPASSAPAPADSTTRRLTIATLLDETASVIHTNDLRDRPGRTEWQNAALPPAVTLYGAMNITVSGDPSDTRGDRHGVTSADLVRTFADFLGVTSALEWSEEPGRTHAEIMHALRFCASAMRDAGNRAQLSAFLATAPEPENDRPAEPRNVMRYRLSVLPMSTGTVYGVRDVARKVVLTDVFGAGYGSWSSSREAAESAVNAANQEWMAAGGWDSGLYVDPDSWVTVDAHNGPEKWIGHRWNRYITDAEINRTEINVRILSID